MSDTSHEAGTITAVEDPTIVGGLLSEVVADVVDIGEMGDTGVVGEGEVEVEVEHTEGLTSVMNLKNLKQKYEISLRTQCDCLCTNTRVIHPFSRTLF